ncbi:hypothetical protein L1987_79113 [Smallanthus sonchifolius]|uniref:Uncharacterized protein n=1 Tax=Smallanthus sonchifolius TaxID=185202 RepID=A0ACB8ZDR6_9ASTR|nr:hypothetical protein L1987_79113 [Smallanthus sonchifolius]
MIESDLNTGNNAHIERLGFHRDPSFSGWGVNSGKNHPNGVQESEIVNTSEVDDDFELPVLQVSLNSEEIQSDEGQSQLHDVKMNGNGHMDMVSPPSPRRGNKNENYASFDIENAYDRDRELGSRYTDFVYKHKDGLSSSKNPIAVSDILKTLFLILMWYIFSTLLTLYNKTLLGDDMGRFPAPLLMNTVHFAMQAVLSRGIIYFWSQKFEPTVPMARKDYFMRVVPTALATSLDINLSNASLVFISVTFATMCKSASPIFLLIFAFAFRLETPSVKLLGIMLIISVGILLTVAKETAFEFWGFIFVMLAAVMSGFRWSMTQILLQKEVYGLKNPLVLMSYVTPVMAVATALFSLLMDPWDEFRKSSYFDSSWHVTRSALLMLLGGTFAFFMVLTEYILVSITSAVTVTIAGVVKEAVTILVAVFYFHDEFTWLKGAGLVTIMFGVSLFNWYKYQKFQNTIASGDDMEENRNNIPAKYVILEDMENEEDNS